MKALLSELDATDIRDLVLITLFIGTLASGARSARELETMARTFDQRCYELAAHFLSDEPDLNTEAARTTLAAEIQDCIELEIQFMRRSMEKAQ